MEMNNIQILPSKAKGVITAPPSKSDAHRLLICAGLANGASTVRNLCYSEDILATLDCLRALGAEIIKEGSTVHILGVSPADFRPTVLECRECGSTLRFFVPIALLSGERMIFTGSSKLLERPMDVYKDICRAQELTFMRRREEIITKGRLSSGRFTVRGNLSSQFISGLLFALPLLDKKSVIDILPPFESASYVDLTLDALERFGVRVEHTEPLCYNVPGGQKYKPQQVTVEGDYSNAAFFEALNYLGGEVKVEGLREESRQGDRVYKEYFEALCAGTPTLDLSDCPDLGPVMMAMAAAQNGARFTGTERLRIKESDRVESMAKELSKFGAELIIGENEVEVNGRALYAPKEVLDGHNDHRIVMALSILLTKTGGKLRGASAVKKSMPDFFDKLTELGIEVLQNGMDQ